MDIQLGWDNTNWRGDWSLTDAGTLADDRDLETSVLLSLFTDRTARPGDVIPDSGIIRGWWADTYRRYPLGSRLWLLWREKQTETTRKRAEEYARESLQWMIDSQAARTVVATAAWIARGMLELVIEITPPIGERKLWRFVLAWAQLAGSAA
jgi:phage gp46-like protein